MYTIFADNIVSGQTQSICIFDDTSPDRQQMAISPKLTLTAGAAGSLNITLAPGCAGYNDVRRLTTTIRVERDGNTIWTGRVLKEQADIWRCRHLFCEGAMAWLNDPVMPTSTVTGTATTLLTAILGAYDGSSSGTYNAKVAANRRIAVGTCSVSGSDLTLAPDYGTALETVNKLVSGYGGILRMRYVSGVPTLDWLADYPAVTGDEQPLVFGENLLDFTRNWDLTDYATVCYVRGGEIANTEPAQTAFGSYTLASAVALYGTIEKFLSLTDLTTNQECAAAAEHYLKYEQFDGMALDVTALDLHIINPAVKSYDVMQRVPVQAPLYNLDAIFAVTNMDIPLDAPEGTRYTIGPVNVAYVRRIKTITQVAKQNDDDLNDRVDAEHSYTEQGLSDARDYADDAADAAQAAAEQTAAEALQEAKQEIDATMSSLTEGYIFIDTNGTNTQGIYITNSPIHSVSEITSGMKVWKWSMTGLGFSDDGGSTWRTAMTYDGKINADMILTGLLMAQYIKLYGDMAVFNASGANVPSGYLGYGAGHNGYDPTDGIHMYVGNNEVICTASGVRISCGGNQIYVDFNNAEVTCDLHVIGDITATGNITANVPV